MDQIKVEFLKNDLAPRLKGLNANDAGKWGLMNAQQMTEHVADFFKVSFEKVLFPLVTPEEHLPKFKAFLMSDKEFRENTKAPVLPEQPFPVRNACMQDAINELQGDVISFFEYFEKDLSKKTIHPVFGELDLTEWVQLHHKHVTHHFKQFGLI